MKVLHVTYSLDGGAGIACKRLHEALLKSGVDSNVLVARLGARSTAKKSVAFGNIRLFFNRVQNSLLYRLSNKLLDGQPRSISLFRTGLHKPINAFNPDLVHLHWPCAEMIAIEEIARINAPIVWTLHDMWPFCGAEHYSDSDRYISGYQKAEIRDRHSTESEVDVAKGSFVDIDRWVFKRKIRCWNAKLPSIVTPSNWLAACARQSQLFRHQEVVAIPNCLDLNVFKPMQQEGCRQQLGLPMDKKLVLFGAFTPSDHRKGGDLLQQSLSRIESPDLELVVFGAESGPRIAGLTTHWLGSFKDEADLAQLYNAVDVITVPSRQEVFGQTASEPLACGVPVVAFDIGGLSDIVDHKTTGYLAKPFDADDLKDGIEYVLGLPKAEYELMCANARTKAERDFDESRVADQYVGIYQSMLGK